MDLKIILLSNTKNRVMWTSMTLKYHKLVIVPESFWKHNAYVWWSRQSVDRVGRG